MCKHGEEVICRVPIHQDDSCTGELRWVEKGVDSCLAERVNKLNADGYLTRTCCCGHGESPGSIILHDGTVIPA